MSVSGSCDLRHAAVSSKDTGSSASLADCRTICRSCKYVRPVQPLSVRSFSRGERGGILFEMLR